jgi:hypothetical protein
MRRAMTFSRGMDQIAYIAKYADDGLQFLTAMCFARKSISTRIAVGTSIKS